MAEDFEAEDSDFGGSGLGAMEVGSSTEMGASGASHLGTGDRGQDQPVNSVIQKSASWKFKSSPFPKPRSQRSSIGGSQAWSMIRYGSRSRGSSNRSFSTRRNTAATAFTTPTQGQRPLQSTTSSSVFPSIARLAPIAWAVLAFFFILLEIHVISYAFVALGLPPVAVNVGGAVVPVLISVYLLMQMTSIVVPSLIGVAIVTAIVHRFAIPVPGMGIATRC